LHLVGIISLFTIRRLLGLIIGFFYTKYHFVKVKGKVHPGKGHEGPEGE